MFWIITEDLNSRRIGKSQVHYKNAPVRLTAERQAADSDTKRQLLDAFKDSLDTDFHIVDSAGVVYYRGKCASPVSNTGVLTWALNQFDTNAGDITLYMQSSVPQTWVTVVTP